MSQGLQFAGPAGPEPQGPFALVGSGEFLEVMEAVDLALLAGRPPRAVFLPTAAALEGADRIAYWVRLGTEHYTRLGVEPVPLEVLDRTDAERSDLAAAIDGAGLIYLSGGSPAYLADTLRGSAVFSAIVAAHARGAALAGCSAGAMALAAVADDVRNRRPCPGLGLLPDLVVLPHFDRIERWFPGMVEDRLRGLTEGRWLVGIDEETALVGGPSVWTVRGRGRVWVVESDGSRVPHSPGAELELDRR
ncbi:MAG: Type 1 glutamine amidotransferase-like domain-containing protein [Acidimicrobiia bacterium]